MAVIKLTDDKTKYLNKLIDLYYDNPYELDKYLHKTTDMDVSLEMKRLIYQLVDKDFLLGDLVNSINTEYMALLLIDVLNHLDAVFNVRGVVKPEVYPKLVSNPSTQAVLDTATINDKLLMIHRDTPLTQFTKDTLDNTIKTLSSPNLLGVKFTDIIPALMVIYNVKRGTIIAEVFIQTGLSSAKEDS